MMPLVRDSTASPAENVQPPSAISPSVTRGLSARRLQSPRVAVVDEQNWLLAGGLVGLLEQPQQYKSAGKLVVVQKYHRRSFSPVRMEMMSGGEPRQVTIHARLLMG